MLILQQSPTCNKNTPSTCSKTISRTKELFFLGPFNSGFCLKQTKDAKYKATITVIPLVTQNELHQKSLFLFKKSSFKNHCNQHTFKILISFPSKICDFDKFFLLMLFMATSQSVFCKQRNRKVLSALIFDFIY